MVLELYISIQVKNFLIFLFSLSFFNSILKINYPALILILCNIEFLLKPAELVFDLHLPACEA